MSILDKVNLPEDIKKLTDDELIKLCEEIRELLLLNVLKTGGHLASNLGVVELTIALHKVFNAPNDKIIFDVGHQSYVHKILTGRKDRIDTLRQMNGLCGFTKPSESKYDAFIGGHSSTSISAALGYASADVIQGNKNYSVAVIGDGALTGGIAFEALNNAGRSNTRIIIVLNDNEMSISKNVGAIAKYLAKIRIDPLYFRLKDAVFNTLNKIPYLGKRLIEIILHTKSGLKETLYHNTMFEDMGFTYLGPVDGHDIKKLSKLLERAKSLQKPVLIHALTVKGKGFTDAEKRPDLFHGIQGIDFETGEPHIKINKSFSEAFGESICVLAEKNDKICAVTAAMASGTGLAQFSKQFKNRFFDVGIAEQHAVTFCAGLASNGMIPVFAVYSSFLQRAYDQIIHDVAMQNVKVIFAIDRAGIVGEDGETHQGIFDTAYLNHIPNITIFAPSNCDELKIMLEKAIYEVEGATAIRFPRGEEQGIYSLNTNENNNYEILYNTEKKDILLISYGRQIFEVISAANDLNNTGLNVSVLKINKIKPISIDIFDVIKEYKNVYFIEEAIKTGGIGEMLASSLNCCNLKYTVIGIEGFVTHGSYKELLKLCKLDAESLKDIIVLECKH